MIFSRAMLEHVAAGELREAKDAGKIHVDDSLPVVFRVFSGRGAANDAGVINQDIDPAEMLDGFFDEHRTDGGVTSTSPTSATDFAPMASVAACVALGTDVEP